MNRQNPPAPPPQAPDSADVKLAVRYKILTGMYRRLTGPSFWGSVSLRQEYERLSAQYREMIASRTDK